MLVLHLRYTGGRKEGATGTQAPLDHQPTFHRVIANQYERKRLDQAYHHALTDTRRRLRQMAKY